MNIAVIGAGPAGLMAAIQAAEGGGRITLFEHNPNIGRKLLVTGSSRCNLSNDAVEAAAYYCEDPTWMETVLGVFGVEEFRRALDRLGIPTQKTDDGWYYPRSQSAQAVAEVLGEALAERGIELRVATHVSQFFYENEAFQLLVTGLGLHQIESFDRLVLGAGGKAYPELGSRGELFGSLEKLGHTVKPLQPALGPIFTELGAFKELKGQRFDVLVSIWRGEEKLGQTTGNIIINQDGFNGPGVMNLSHLVALHPGADLSLQVNFIAPFWSDLADILTGQVAHPCSLRAGLLRYFSPKAADFFIRQAGLDPAAKLNALSEEQIRKLLGVTAEAKFRITGSGSFKNSQVSVGGVRVGEVDPLSMESKLIPGLYLVGETLDVAGPCGGFNLHFAFGSGYLAGTHLAGLQRKLSKERT
ncbi:MAG TPA: aminoacetone oxidase family FAD-binding enzyme [Anaerolineaceae bacterium]|nr:aminoacetone oxidase family FAD-binding enzyme [Anaerolineaceae bacterium]